MTIGPTNPATPAGGTNPGLPCPDGDLKGDRYWCANCWDPVTQHDADRICGVCYPRRKPATSSPQGTGSAPTSTDPQISTR